MSDKPIVPGDLFARAQIIGGLRQLADFLEANPAVPIREYGYTLHQFTPNQPDQTSRAHIQAVAELLGVEALDETDRGGHLYAERTFGRITYQLCHIPQRSREDYQARRSYEDNVVLDPDQAA